MSNRDTHAALSYHEATKLSYINLKNKPPLYKRYEGLPAVPLPLQDLELDVPTLEAIGSPLARTGPFLDLQGLGRLLHLSAGLVRKADLPVAGEVHYRAAASAGALYPIEIYAVCRAIPGLGTGVYHYSPAESCLVQLRQGDYREVLGGALGDPAWATDRPATLVLAANFWRSAWKYRLRSYRYCFWDAGTILSNLLAAASAAGLPAHLLAGFWDDGVNNLLALDSSREAAVCLVSLGERLDAPAPTPPVPGDWPSLRPKEVDEIANRIDYPEIEELHRASSLESREEAATWGTGPEAAATGLENAPGPAPSPPRIRESSGPLGEAILQRGSTRRFARTSIALARFKAALAAASAPIAADFLPPGQPSLLDTYVIANAVEGLEPGSYYYSAADATLEPLRLGDLRHEAGHLCFEQALGADASGVFYFMADLDKVLARCGNRGYRAAQIESGIRGGRVYLAAHSLGLGATGMTFYDDDVTEFFSPHAEGKSLMFLTALGETHQVNRVRPFRSRVGILLDSLARGAGNRGSVIQS